MEAAVDMLTTQYFIFRTQEITAVTISHLLLVKFAVFVVVIVVVILVAVRFWFSRRTS